MSEQNLIETVNDDLTDEALDRTDVAKACTACRE